MDDVHFSLIKVAGYRGRHFTLKMNPSGQNTIFIMDGNTGKTTTIELLRWCFHYPESQATNKFTHMWVVPAHVLDDTKKGPQACEITIQFAATDDEGDEHFYQFKRVTEGESDPNNKPTTDKITRIIDTLEIDHGKDAKRGDEAHEYLKHAFRFNECVDYFCFDGEKARDIMQLSSNSEKIGDLIFLVNQRATHPRIEEYKQKLNGLRNRVLEEAGAKVSDQALAINIGKLKARIGDLRALEKERDQLKQDIATHSLALKTFEDRYKDLQEKITTAKAEELVERTKYEIQIQGKTKEVMDKRRLLYALGSQWICTDANSINWIKMQVKEKGKLPEPYRQDLIQNCLASGCCEICGRSLDKASEERIKGLERQVAPHEVHEFLSYDLKERQPAFDSEKERKEIKRLIEECNRLDNKMKSIKLSEEDAQLISEKEFVEQEISTVKGKIINLQRDVKEREEWIKDLKEEVEKLQSQNITLKEYKIILDKIDESINTIVAAGEKIKSKTIDIISGVISEGVQSILGSRFSAKLSPTEGLMLGEDGFYGRERGGYSGRLILSYCFAEAMTLVDPIIVDTPSGNIGSQRANLAQHLVENHRQIILMCLPTEIADFGPIISPKPIPITNKEG
jgi:hypothetical protein